MATATVKDVCGTALKLILVESAESPLEPDEYQDAMKSLNYMLLDWAGSGIDLGHTIATAISQDMTVPDGALRGIIANLAIDIQPQYNGQLLPGVAKMAKEGKETCENLGMSLGPMQHHPNLPIGSGNEANISYLDSPFYGDLEQTILTEAKQQIAVEDNT